MVIVAKLGGARSSCCMQAVVLVAGQASNMRDPVLNADPLYAVTGMLTSVVAEPHHH